MYYFKPGYKLLLFHAKNVLFVWQKVIVELGYFIFCKPIKEFGMNIERPGRRAFKIMNVNTTPLKIVLVEFV